MGLTEIVFRIKPVVIGSITLDASVREIHDASSKVTRHPIEAEEGSPATISDHILVDPLTVNISGVISGHPTEIAATLQNLFARGGKDPVKDAYETLVKDLTQGRLVTIFTTLKEYKDMVLEKVSVTRDAKSGNSLVFNAIATQVTLAELETIEVPVAPQRSTKAGGKKAKKGTTVSETTQARTVVIKLYEQGFSQ